MSSSPKLLEDNLSGYFTLHVKSPEEIDIMLLDRFSRKKSNNDSWVDLHSQCLQSPGRVTPPFVSAGEEYLRLLKEAQRESNQSSAIVSSASSNRASLRGSPKSPPNSPNTEPCLEEDLKDVYINYYSRDGDLKAEHKNTDWIWDWSSRPDQLPPKDWKFQHPEKKAFSIRNAKVGKIGLFSKEVLYTLIFTNILSLIIGTGVGMWLTRRNCFSSINIMISD